MKKVIEICDNCEEEEEDKSLYKCKGCNRILCSECATEHLEEDHIGEIIDNVFDDWFDKIEGE